MKNLQSKFNIPLFNELEIKEIKQLNSAFGAFCKKVIFTNEKKIIVKGLNKKSSYSSVYYEGLAIKFMYNKFPDIFPKVYYLNQKMVVMEYIEHNNIRNKNSNREFAQILSSIHKIKNKKCGFDFDTPIGGMRQPSQFSNSWIDFYSNSRLLVVYEKINSLNPMPKEINIKIEKLIKNIKNFIPNSINPSLIHGDLWSGNILFKNGKLTGLIDPGIYYAHNELELAYLTWFKYVNKNFLDIYNEYIPIEKEFFEYQEIYQLYYSLLNVLLWDRNYILDVNKLIGKFI